MEEKKLPISLTKPSAGKGERSFTELTGNRLWDIYALVYDLIQRRSLPYRQLIAQVCSSLYLPAGGRVLDAGCGTGNFLEQVGDRLSLSQAVGMDMSEAMLRRARKKVQKDKTVALQKVDLNKPLSLEKDYFDGVVCVNVLYCTEDPLFTLTQLTRVMKKGGRLVLVTPPARPRIAPLFAEQARLFKKKYPLGWPVVFLADQLVMLPFMPLFLLINLFIKGEEKFHFLQRNELQALAEKAGLEVELIENTYAGQGWLLVASKGAH